MVESKNIIETLSNTKFVGYFLALMGVALFFIPLAWRTLYILTVSSEPLLVTAFYTIGDIAQMAAAVVLWVISIKILQAKS